MATLKRENGKHIVTIEGRRYEFYTMRFALIFITMLEEGALCIST